MMMMCQVDKTDKTEHFRNLFLFNFNQGSKTTWDIVLCTDKVLLLKELHRSGFHTSRRGNSTSWTLHVLADFGSMRTEWMSSSMRIHTNPLGNWPSRWDTFMIPSSFTFTWQHNVLLQHDNTHPYGANLTKTAFQELGWEVLPHSLYSPDLAPSVYHLFQLLSNSLRGIPFNNNTNTELKTWLREFFESRPDDFYCWGIDKVVEY